MNKYCDFNKKHKIEIAINWNLYEAELIFLEEFLNLIFIIFIVCVCTCAHDTRLWAPVKDRRQHRIWWS